MKWTGDIKAVYIDLPEDMHAEVKAAAAKRRMPTKKAYVEGMTEWIERHKGTSTQDVKNDTESSQVKEASGILAGISEEHRQCHVALQLVLNSGNPLAQKIAFDGLDNAVSAIPGQEPVVHEALDISEEDTQARLARAIEDAQKLKGLNPPRGKETPARPPKRRTG